MEFTGIDSVNTPITSGKLMKPKKQEQYPCDDLFCMRLEQMLDQRCASYIA